jgi:hypothetical protein
MAANSRSPEPIGGARLLSAGNASGKNQSHFLIIGQVDLDSGWNACSAGITAFTL